MGKIVGWMNVLTSRHFLLIDERDGLIVLPWWSHVALGGACLKLCFYRWAACRVGWSLVESCRMAALGQISLAVASQDIQRKMD